MAVFIKDSFLVVGFEYASHAFSFQIF
jgi:hypothetical protein